MRKKLTFPPALSVTNDVATLLKGVNDFLSSRDSRGEVPCSANCGIYVFYDYDNEPIYVGKTVESLRGRIGRHLTGQRSDAVAKNILDPFEVAEVEVYAFPEFNRRRPDGKRLEKEDQWRAWLKSLGANATIAGAEYTVFKNVRAKSKFGTVLNEQDIAAKPTVKLPASHRGRIVPEILYDVRKHPDTRIARRAETLARLARSVEERDASKGLRRTLHTQAERLLILAKARLDEIKGPFPEEAANEETDAENER